MAKAMGGDLVLQLLHESREHQKDYQGFKHEMLEFKLDYLHFKHEMLEFKQEMREFKQEMREFKQEMQEFKQEMREFKAVTEQRLDLLHQGLAQAHDYLKLLVGMVQDIRQVLHKHSDQLADHEQRLTVLEK